MRFLLPGALARAALAMLVPIGSFALPPTAGGGEVRVVSPEERRHFYRTGGKELLGRPVHLHVDAEVLRKAPHEFTDRSGTRFVRFEDHGIPITVPARSPYWLQVRRHLDGAREFCVHGRVRLVAGDERQRAGVEVTRVVRAPGSWR